MKKTVKNKMWGAIYYASYDTAPPFFAKNKAVNNWVKPRKKMKNKLKN